MNKPRSTPVITVAICTYNRAAGLQRTLQTLLEASRSVGPPWELLLVDNNSSDATPDLVPHFAEHIPLRYVIEPRQGASYARNRAIHEAQAPFVLFTDDDVDVQPGWLEAYIDLLERKPDVGFAGGIIRPAWQAMPPKWVVRHASNVLSGVMVWYDEGEREWEFEPSSSPFYTANAGFRVEAAQAVGGFDPALGPNKRGRLLGEDVRLVEQLAQHGFPGVYLPNAVVKHRIEPERWTRRFLFKSFVGHGRERILSNWQMPRQWIGSFPLRSSTQIIPLALKYCYAEATRNPDRWLPALFQLGRAAGEWQEFRLARAQQDTP